MARTQEREPWAPAIVRGNHRTAVAIFIEDARGDLVDIEYHCEEAAPKALPWPGYEWPTDYDVYCQDCGVLINAYAR